MDQHIGFQRQYNVCLECVVDCRSICSGISIRRVVRFDWLVMVLNDGLY